MSAHSGWWRFRGLWGFRSWWRTIRSLGGAHIRPFRSIATVWFDLAKARRAVDANYYLEANPDVVALGLPAVVHYALFGAAEGRRPAALLPSPRSSPTPIAAPDARRHESAERFYEADHPEVSIVVLNLDGARLTLACLESLWQHTAGYRYEIVVVDNGSGPGEFAELAASAGRFRLVRLSTNRFFGEGNNIGAEAARAPNLFFLNNDTLVTPGWLAPLMRVMEEHSDAGAVGPTLVFPDGRLQEAGATLDREAFAVQRHRGTRADLGSDLIEVVDYCSAAALLVRRSAFESALGFDLAWEPAYYEDCDLCLKLASAGWRTYHCSGSRVIHLEHATAGDASQPLKCGPSLIEINRAKFLDRWSEYLAAREGASPDTVAHRIAGVSPSGAGEQGRPSRTTSPRRRLGLYTAHTLITGGGERYLLTVAEAAQSEFDVTLVTRAPYSRLRVLQLGREFDLDLRDVSRATPHELASKPRFDVFVAMDTAVLPATPARGRRNLYVCQFPFPMGPQALAERWGNLDGYDRLVVYSEFARQHTLAAMARLALGTAPPVDIVAPPVARVGGSDEPRSALILSVGRFYAGGHPKRHDILLDAFEGLHHQWPEAELHLAGALHPEAHHRDHLLRLQERAHGLPVTFHVNPPRPTIEALYRRASVYWHATGFGSSALTRPEHMEHFGIAVAEAMSAGSVPVCFAAGGPLEIVSHGQTGFLYDTLDELRAHTLRVLASPSAGWVSDLRRAAMTASARYDQAVFATAIRSLLD